MITTMMTTVMIQNQWQQFLAGEMDGAAASAAADVNFLTSVTGESDGR